MTTTHLTLTALTTAASAVLALALSAPAQANPTAPGAVAGNPGTTDIALVVADRKARAAQFAVDHAAELSR
jgi:hypothetical protein